MATLKEQLGCWLNERWKTELVLRSPKLAQLLGLSWLDLCNRSEVLQPDLITGGRICQWQFSSRLTVARFFPEVGGRLLHHCLTDWPINLQPVNTIRESRNPEVSIIVGVRGKSRLPQFFACLASLQAQEGIDYEIIVVEQSWENEFEKILPRGVKYFHQKSPTSNAPYNRSWAFNFGVKKAQGKNVVLHDADMLVPKKFAISIANILSTGLDAVRLPRFIFYLDQHTSEFIQKKHILPTQFAVSEVIANNRTPIATTKDVYLEIGGHDEDFWGWGGEDDEFMDRLRTFKISEGAYLPIIHLWHPASPQKANGDRNNQILIQKMTCSSQVRINTLKQKNEML
ncbi:glycosyltransferase family 2 protein [Anabaenopsis tanganyikae CS-531]|uniref:Glycosyltransferase family 2 protein n=1 Tax=Anabaenopsis tanganyikae CS-531 TaxID=2785304 RepID=A0ABT6KFI7_9CYAN|nr:glycosyltransferase family A protein [Anabaenopsis tanganyikae]MDH6106149.1 glycosyltransferase family 2 protein [Anabaenopsis tanganyikae CS-531]